MEFDTYYSIASIRNSIDTSDELYSKAQEYFDEVSPKFQELSTNYYKVLINLPFKDELKDELGALLFDRIDLSLKTFSPEIIEDIIEAIVGNIQDEYDDEDDDDEYEEISVAPRRSGRYHRIEEDEDEVSDYDQANRRRGKRKKNPFFKVVAVLLVIAIGIGVFAYSALSGVVGEFAEGTNSPEAFRRRQMVLRNGHNRSLRRGGR